MLFRDTPEEAAFRQVVHSFIEKEAPRGERGPQAYGMAGAREFMKKLAERRWIAPAWPKEYGGAGMSVMQQFIFNQEMASVGAPRGGNYGIGTGWAGPTIILYGSEEQKKKYLPPIVKGEAIWCQGFSEPGAGSDL